MTEIEELRAFRDHIARVAGDVLSDLRIARNSKRGSIFEQVAYELRERSKSEATPAEPPVAWLFQHDETGRTMLVEQGNLVSARFQSEHGTSRYREVGPLYLSSSPRAITIIEGENDCSAGCGRLADTESEYQGPMCHECYADMLERIIERKDRELAESAEVCAKICEAQVTGFKSDLHEAYDNGAKDCAKHIREYPESPSPRAKQEDK